MSPTYPEITADHAAFYAENGYLIVRNARNKIKAALERQGIAFSSSWADPALTMEQRVDYSIDVLG